MSDEETAFDTGGPVQVVTPTDDELGEAVYRAATALGGEENLIREYEEEEKPRPAPEELEYRADATLDYAIRMRQERAAFKEEMRRLEQQNEDLRRRIEPVAEYIGERRAAEEAARRKAEEPDPEQEPQKYAEWLLKRSVSEVLEERETAREKRAREQAEAQWRAGREHQLQQNLQAAYSWEDSNASPEEKAAAQTFLERRVKERIGAGVPEAAALEQSLYELRNYVWEGWRQNVTTGYGYVKACVDSWGWGNGNGRAQQVDTRHHAVVPSAPDEDVEHHRRIQRESPPPPPARTRPAAGVDGWQEFEATWKQIASHNPSLFNRRLRDFAERSGRSVDEIRQSLLASSGALAELTA